MNHEPRLWQHDNLWRIQDRCQLTLSNGTVQDAWESWRDEQRYVMLFATEEQAREYMQNSGKETQTI